jgi:hypothetical protein
MKHTRSGIKTINSTMKSVQAYAQTKATLDVRISLPTLILLKMNSKRLFPLFSVIIIKVINAHSLGFQVLFNLKLNYHLQISHV